MAVRTGGILTLSFLVSLTLSPAPAAQALSLDNALAVPQTETLTPALCVDAWQKTRPCRPSVQRTHESAHPADATNRWWSGLWSAAGEMASSPRFRFAGRRASCGGGHDGTALLKLDFLHFQLNMDVDLDEEQDRFDTVRFAYRSCWR